MNIKTNDFDWRAVLAMNVMAFDEDRMAGVDYALSSLKERERQFLLMRFKDGKTVAQISEELGLTRQYVYYTLNRAMKRLSCPARIGYIAHGKKGYENIKEEEAIQRVERVCRSLSPYKEWFRRDTNPEIMALDLPIRAYNALCRANLRDIKEVVDAINDGSILKIRNLGTKSYKEICNKLAHYIKPEIMEGMR